MRSIPSGGIGPRRGLPKNHRLIVSQPQRAELVCLARQLRRTRSVAFRVRIIIEGVGGLSSAAMTGKLRTKGSTVGSRRNRSLGSGSRCGNVCEIRCS